MPGVRWPAFPTAEVLSGEEITDLGSTTLRGDLRSYAWDGGSDLSGGADTDATAGFFLDSSAGAIQAQNLIAEGGTFTDVTITGVLTSTAGSSIDWTHVDNVSVTNADIVNLSFSKITAATNTASLVIGSGGEIKSSNFSAGSAGFRVLGSGSAEFNSVTVRGTIVATSGSLSNLDISGTLTLSGGRIDSATSGFHGRMVGGGSPFRFHNGGTEHGSLVVSSLGVGFISNPGVDLRLQAQGPGPGDVIISGAEVRIDPFAYIGGTTSSSPVTGLYVEGSASSSTRPMRLYGITATTSHRIFDALSNVGGTGTTRAFLEADGDWFNVNGTFGTISDRRLKTKASIKPARSYLDDLLKLQVRKYRLKRQKPVLLGFVADEVAEVFPGLVKTGSDGYDLVKTSVLTPMLVTAVQELAERLSRLEVAA